MAEKLYGRIYFYLYYFIRFKCCFVFLASNHMLWWVNLANAVLDWEVILQTLTQLSTLKKKSWTSNNILFILAKNPYKCYKKVYSLQHCEKYFFSRPDFFLHIFHIKDSLIKQIIYITVTAVISQSPEKYTALINLNIQVHKWFFWYETFCYSTWGTDREWELAELRRRKWERNLTVFSLRRRSV